MTRQELIEFRTARGVYTRSHSTRFDREVVKREVRSVVIDESIIKRLEARSK